MTVEYALRLARQWSQGHICTLREGEAKEYHKLVASLLEKELSQNDPLTLEELREMDGEPVYMVFYPNHRTRRENWVLVGTQRWGAVSFMSTNGWTDYDIAVEDFRARFYIRPPEGEGI